MLNSNITKINYIGDHKFKINISIQNISIDFIFDFFNETFDDLIKDFEKYININLNFIYNDLKNKLLKKSYIDIISRNKITYTTNRKIIVNNIKKFVYVIIQIAKGNLFFN